MAPKQDKIDGMDKWEVEGAADTLVRAKEIEANPKLHKAALGVISRKMVAERQVKLDAAKAAGKSIQGKEPTVSITP